MPHGILAIGDSYLPARDMERYLGDLGPEFTVEYRTVDPDARPSIPELREVQGDPAEVDGWLTDQEVLLVHAAPVTKELLERHPHVRVVACARGGAVNIDVNAAKRLGVTVLNTPAKNAVSVADLTMTSIHQLFRGATVARAWLSVEAELGHTHFDSTFVGGNFIAREPRGFTLGLVGLGAIGARVAKQAQFYGMTVVAHDPFARSPIEGVALLGLDELLAEADVVSLHAPATKDTFHIADEGFFARMKPGAFFINTARESLVNEDALVAALNSGQVAGAVLDVCEPDGRWPDLSRRPNVVVTPHLGGATIQTQARGLKMLVDDLHRWAEGAEPERRVV